MALWFWPLAVAIASRTDAGGGLAHDIQQSVSAGLGGIGDFILDIGAGGSDLYQKSDPIKSVTESWPLAATAIVLGYAVLSRK